MIARVKKFINHPQGPKTTHFWGPIFNMGFVMAGVLDMNKPPERISTKMTSVLMLYSTMFARYAWMIDPRNMYLLVIHCSNVCVQGTLLLRKSTKDPNN